MTAYAAVGAVLIFIVALAGLGLYLVERAPTIGSFILPEAEREDES